MKRYVHIFTKGDSAKNLLCAEKEYVNIINRMWLVARATQTKVLAVSLMTNHLHMVVQTSSPVSFMYHLNNACERYYRTVFPGVKSPKLLRFGMSNIQDPEIDCGTDLKDAIMYVSRNAKLHGFANEALSYRWSTARMPFRLFPCPRAYSFADVPPSVANMFLPSPHILPQGWFMSTDGSLIPTVDVYPVDLIETLFDTPSGYIKSMGVRTSREDQALSNETLLSRSVPLCASAGIPITDQDIKDYVAKHFFTAVGQVPRRQLLGAMRSVKESYPQCSRRMLARVFNVPLFYVPLHI